MRVRNILVAVNFVSALMFGADPDLVIGKWKLNWEKSRCHDPAPRSVVRTYHKSGNGVHVSEVWVESDGKSNTLNYTARYDGKDYPVRTSKDETIAFTRHDVHTAEGVSKENGALAYAFKRTASEDGKTLTIETMKTDSTGKVSSEIFVYDRIK